MRLTILCPLVFALTASASAQDFTHFEVATIRPVDVSQTSSGGVPVYPTLNGIGTPDPTHITYKGTWLINLITPAFNLKGFQVTIPSSVASQRYDISAKIPDGATREQFNVMLQNLLKERFHLTYHLESKMFPVYAVVIGKNGAKLTESSKDPPPDAPRAAGSVDDQGFPTLAPAFTGVRGVPGNGRMKLAAQRASLDKVLGMLGDSLDRPIIDQTGLAGLYDLKMEFEFRGRPGAPSANAPDPAPTVASALEKLGLKLEPKQMPFDVLVIDRLDKIPTEN
jgi:uncharacterized protein (TIGR03435 family)